MWTQWKSNKIIAGLKTNKEVLADQDSNDQSTAVGTDKESASSTENLLTPKRHNI